MDHISANLAFGRRKKNIWGYKKLQGGKKPIRKTEKKSGDLFIYLFFFGDSKKFVGAAKNEQGAANSKVRPLPNPWFLNVIVNMQILIDAFQNPAFQNPTFQNHSSIQYCIKTKSKNSPQFVQF